VLALALGFPVAHRARVVQLQSPVVQPVGRGRIRLQCAAYVGRPPGRLRSRAGGSLPSWFETTDLPL
jgi:hypothetical protein